MLLSIEHGVFVFWGTNARQRSTSGQGGIESVVFTD
jgi:hypothetical protein